jgi:hypothetical protein
VKDKARISYVLDARSDSVFNFKTSTGIFKDKYIKYEVGVGVGKAQEKRSLILSGAWKLKKNIGLTFEIEYENKEVHAIAFGAEAKLNKRDSISFELKDKEDKGLGAQIELSRKILKGEGLSFLRFLKTQEESVVTVGAGFGW